MRKYINILMLISIVLAGVVPYVNALHNPFIWDEEEMIVGNPIVKEWKYFPLLFRTSIFGGPIEAGGFYRPIYMLSFMLDYRLWGLNTVGYHLFSVAFHILNGFLLYALILKLGLDKKVAWLAGLFFVSFPVSCQVVTLIGGRVELVLGFFFLSGVLFFLKGVQRSKIYFLGAIPVFVLALLTKESALVLPFIIAIYVFIFMEKDKRKRAALPLSALISMAFIYCGLRFIFLGSPFHRTLSLINEASFLERVYTLPRILLTYMRLILFPVVLKSEYHFVVRSVKDPYVWLGIPVLIIIFNRIYKFLWPKKHALFFLSWFFLGLLPYSNIVIPLHATLMEHWAYFSSMAFAVLMSMAVFQIMRRMPWKGVKYVLTIAIAALFLFYAIRIIERNKEWRDPFILYQKDLEKEPDSFLLHCNLGVEYFRRGMMKEARREFLASNETCPGKGYDVAYNNLGVIYAREGNIGTAVQCYKTSIALNNYMLAYENLGGLYNNLGMHKEAILLLEQASRLYPLSAEIKRQLGIAYSRTGRPGQALQK